MTIQHLSRTALSLLLTLSCALARGEDIDLYAGVDASGTGNPTVLVVVDNSTSASLPIEGTTKLGATRTALIDAIGALTDVTGRLNVGVIAFNGADDGASPPATLAPRDGATIVVAARSMGSAANRAAVIAGLGRIDVPASARGGAQFALALEEARRYAGGLSILAGNDTPSSLDASAADAGRSRYVSPLSTAGCQKVLVVVIGNGPPARRDATLAAPYAAALNGGALPVALPLPAPYPAPPLPASQDAASNWLDEMAGAVYRAPYADVASAPPPPDSILTYAIGFHDQASAAENAPAFASGRALLRNAAAQGRGRYVDATGTATLRAAIAGIFAEAQSVTAMFASPSLPASVNAAGTYADNVYYGVFQPSGAGAPRWSGNLKGYRLAYDSSADAIELVDARGQPALDAANGFFAPSAESAWTTAKTTGPVLPSGTASVDFFANAPAGVGLTPAQQVTDAPDGSVVDKGGAAQRLRSTQLGDQSRRRVYTCPPTGCAPGTTLAGNPAAAFDRTAITCATHQAAFGLDPATCAGALPALVDWVRGADNTSPDNEAVPGPGGLGASPVRASIHGDVVHGRPLIVDHGAAGVVAYYGSNGGMLHAVSAGAAGTGDELWGFVMPEHFAKLARLRDAAPPLEWPSRSSGATTQPAAPPGARPKDWFVDGALASLVARDASGATTGVYLYVTARRGGSVVYGFDVTTPSAPRVLWRHASHDGTDAAFDDLALTFSGPRVATVAGYARPVVIFGGGYDGGYDATGDPLGEDATPRKPCVPRVQAGCGNRIFVVDAVDGSLVRTFQANAGGGGDLARGIAGDVMPVDAQGAGIADRAYAADTGGAIWRIDFDARGPAEWRMYKLAATADVSRPRKFLQTPDVVVTRGYTAVLVGSGDREKPLAAIADDRFYMVKDKVVAATVASDTSHLADRWPIDLDGTDSDRMIDVTLLGAHEARTRVTAPGNDGWFRVLGTAEKVVNAPLTMAGVVYFGTHQPGAPDAASAGRCTPPLGTARAYALRFDTGVAPKDIDGDGRVDQRDAAVTLAGGGLPPAAVGGLVSVRDLATGANVLVPFVIGGGGTSGTTAAAASQHAPARVAQQLPRSIRKTYWYQRPLP